MSRNLVKHSPAALKYYREQVSLSREGLAKKAGDIDVAKIEKGETENQVFTFKQLQAIAKVLLIPEFLLKTSKTQTKDIPEYIDHRGEIRPYDENSNYALKKAIYELVNNREDLLYTYESIEVEPKPFTLRLTGKDATADAATIREFLKIDENKFTLDGTDDYYHAWRTLLERQDILVLEISRTKIGSEGMALYYETLPIVAILSSGQSNSRKLFTMIHELVHLGLRESAIDGNILQGSLETERYCNRVAGSVLLPEHSLNKLYKDYLPLSENIDFIRQNLKISRQAIAIQLRLTDRIKQSQLDEYLAELDTKNSGWGKSGTQYSAYNHFGKVYIQQVLSAVMTDNISVNSAINILRVKDIAHLQYLEEKVFS